MSNITRGDFESPIELMKQYEQENLDDGYEIQEAALIAYNKVFERYPLNYTCAGYLLERIHTPLLKK